jgi:hypothetical protein
MDREDGSLTPYPPTIGAAYPGAPQAARHRPAAGVAAAEDPHRPYQCVGGSGDRRIRSWPVDPRRRSYGRRGAGRASGAIPRDNEPDPPAARRGATTWSTRSLTVFELDGLYLDGTYFRYHPAPALSRSWSPVVSPPPAALYSSPGHDRWAHFLCEDRTCQPPRQSPARTLTGPAELNAAAGSRARYPTITDADRDADVDPIDGKSAARRWEWGTG